jgi:transcriptional regulator with XRE-family HTH domain
LQTNSSSNATEQLAARIRTARAEFGWSLADLAKRTGLSRAYLSALELGRSKRPGADTIRKLEDVLGPLGSREQDLPSQVPDGLQQLAQERNLPQGEVLKLASLRIRGTQPQSIARWRFIYDAILASENMDSSAE